ncbi:hypothetical protein N7454_008642 [Penicillium verhagenii]|nr:hypothetical protein N7454_008642 [Penicillium verhagenii]
MTQKSLRESRTCAWGDESPVCDAESRKEKGHKKDSSWRSYAASDSERSDSTSHQIWNSDFLESGSKETKDWGYIDARSERSMCWDEVESECRLPDIRGWECDNEKPTADDDGKKLQEELKSLCTRLERFWAQNPEEEDQSFSQMGAASTGIIHSAVPLMEEAKGLCLIASEINFKVNCMMAQRNHPNSMKDRMGELSFLIAQLDKSAVELDTAARKITAEVLNANAAMVKMNAASFGCSEK